MLWIVHIAALVVFFFLMIGFFSRTMAVLAYLIAVSYANRVTPGAYFGLDKINCLLAMYLMLGPCGARYSIDRIWRLRRGAPREVPPSVAANLAIRLIQLHMCIIYLFSGLGKLQGESWWNGEASLVLLGQSRIPVLIDMTWLANHPWLVELPDPRHGLLGAVLLRPGLAAAHAAVGAADGRARPRRHRRRLRHADVRPGDADRQPGVRLAGDGPRAGRPGRQPRRAGRSARQQGRAGQGGRRGGVSRLAAALSGIRRHIYTDF